MNLYEIEYEADVRYLVTLEAKNEEEAREKFRVGDWLPKDVTELECVPGDPISVTEIE